MTQKPFGMFLCWGMAAASWLGCILERYGYLPSDGQHDVHAAEAAVWLVGALILTEFSKWRRL